MQPELMVSLIANVALVILALVLWASRADAKLDHEELAQVHKDLDRVRRELAACQAKELARRKLLSEAGKKGNAAARKNRPAAPMPKKARAKARA